MLRPRWNRRQQPLAEILALRQSVYENSYDLRVTVCKGEKQTSIANKCGADLVIKFDFMCVRVLEAIKRDQTYVSTRDASKCELCCLFLPR